MITGNRFRSCDLGVMSPARCRCAMPVFSTSEADVCNYMNMTTFLLIVSIINGCEYVGRSAVCVQGYFTTLRSQGRFLRKSGAALLLRLRASRCRRVLGDIPAVYAPNTHCCPPLHACTDTSTLSPAAHTTCTEGEGLSRAHGARTCATHLHFAAAG